VICKGCENYGYFGGKRSDWSSRRCKTERYFHLKKARIKIQRTAVKYPIKPALLKKAIISKETQDRSILGFLNCC